MIGRKSYVEDGTFDCDYGQNIHRVLGVGILYVSVSICLPLAYRGSTHRIGNWVLEVARTEDYTHMNVFYMSPNKYLTMMVKVEERAGLALRNIITMVVQQCALDQSLAS